ncbi:hypothetical protein FKP32DRAFT_1592316, partial [Trametes sanguinea]
MTLTVPVSSCGVRLCLSCSELHTEPPFAVETPLADGFPLANQEVQVVVPDVPTASDYFIAS